MSVSPELQRLYASAPDSDQLLETLEISHPLFAATHYLTNAPEGFTATLETAETVDFVALPFGARQPGANGGGQQDLGLVIDNVDREMIDELERASADPTERIAVIYRAYAASDLSAPGAEPIALSISEVAAGLTRIEATAGRTDVLNKRFPGMIYTVALYPGLDR